MLWLPVGIEPSAPGCLWPLSVSCSAAVWTEFSFSFSAVWWGLFLVSGASQSGLIAAPLASKRGEKLLQAAEWNVSGRDIKRKRSALLMRAGNPRWVTQRLEENTEITSRTQPLKQQQFLITQERNVNKKQLMIFRFTNKSKINAASMDQTAFMI